MLTNISTSKLLMQINSMIKQNIGSIIAILAILATLITSLFVFNNVLSSAKSNPNDATSQDKTTTKHKTKKIKKKKKKTQI
jgi:ABC-type spermidine/putrescine transport system permease subunit II